MINVSTKIDAASLHHLDVRMHQLQQDIEAGISGAGKYGGGVVEITAVKLVVALGAATVTAKPFRAIIPNPYLDEAVKDMTEHGRELGSARKVAKMRHAKLAIRFDFLPALGGATGRLPFGNGSVRPLPGVKTISVARQQRGAALEPYGAGGYRGIAKASWSWTLQALGKGSSTPAYPGSTTSSFTKTLTPTGTMATWTGTNRIGYMEHAMKRSASASVHAAASMMKHQSEVDLARAVAKAAA